MNILLRCLVFLAFACSASAADTLSRIHGQWQSDGEATNKYLSKNTRLTAHQKKLFPLFFGNAVIAYNPDGTGSITTKAATLPKKEGGMVEVPARMTTFTYEVVSDAGSQVVIKAVWKDALYDRYPFAILRFEDQDTYSVCLSDGPAAVNGREFFKRVKPGR